MQFIAYMKYSVGTVGWFVVSAAPPPMTSTAAVSTTATNVQSPRMSTAITTFMVPLAFDSRSQYRL